MCSKESLNEVSLPCFSAKLLLASHLQFALVRIWLSYKSTNNCANDVSHLDDEDLLWSLGSTLEAKLLVCDFYRDFSKRCSDTLSPKF